MTRVDDKRVFAEPCAVARSLVARLMGLMGKAGLPGKEGLLIEPCNSIHTFFMRFKIDVVYLKAQNGFYSVIAIRKAKKPWRADLPVFGANAVLELAEGGSEGLSEGDRLCLS